MKVSSMPDDKSMERKRRPRRYSFAKGTCRDFALLMMEAARSLGFAARFVTGYIYVPDRDGSITLGGGSTHAWCQIYLPGAGWAEFDPTNGIVGNRDLIRVGVARDPKQAVPLWGSYDGTGADYEGMSVQSTSQRIITSKLCSTDRNALPIPAFSAQAVSRQGGVALTACSK